MELSPNENYKIKNLLLKYSQIFAVDPKKPGKTDVVKHSVTTISKLIKSIPYRMAPREKEIIKNEISLMLENNMIQHSKSSWRHQLY